MTLTPEQESLVKSRLGDRWWRLNNLYWILDKQGRKVKFRPNWAQSDFYRNLWYLNLILKARQLGLSTFVEIYMLDVLLFNANQSAGIVDKSLEDAQSKLEKMRYAWDHMADEDPGNPEAGVIGAIVRESLTLTTNRAGELEWSNKCRASAGVSHRGGALQYLHISEFGFIAFNDQKRAKEIVSGALNTIAPGQFIFCESTHEGGKTGLHYDMIQEAMGKQGETLTPLDWRFHFYPWTRDPAYVLPADSVTLRPEMVQYFQKLEGHGVTLTGEQKAWYDKKQSQQKEAMFKEFPTIASEAFDAVVRGAIYGKQIADLRAKGRIADFDYDKTRPVFGFWDIGVSDSTSIWAVQFVDDEVRWLDWHENSREPVDHYAGKMREWDRKYGTIHTHFLPHDAGHRQGGTTKTYVEYLREQGLTNVRVVPRTNDVWVGINRLRDLLERSRFHASGCGTPWKKDGHERMSGIACLEAYRTKEIDAGGLVKEEPVHDASSHSADAARMVAEAVNARMVDFSARVTPAGGGKFTPWSQAPKVRVKMGFRGETGRPKLRVRR